MRVLTLCGSIRSSQANYGRVMELAGVEGTIEDFIKEGKRLAGQGRALSNSEIVSAAVMNGVLSRGGEVDYLPIKDLFPHMERRILQLRDGAGNDEGDSPYIDTLSIDQAKLEDLMDRLALSGGVVLATPVYFGDRSSVANKFMQLTARHNLLRDKVFGMASVGAKRNGGQETCNLFGLTEALNQNALVVGNGPPTSQYGGTVVAGNKGQALDDAWGLQTAHGVGVKAAHVAEMYGLGLQAALQGRVRFDILVSMDTPERFFWGYLEKLFAKVALLVPWGDFHLHPVLDSTIYRCLGCKVCPANPAGADGQACCAIEDPDDALEKLRKNLRLSDCVIIAGLNLVDPLRIIYRYQVLIERMRYIRRNNFELTDVLVAALAYNQFGAKVNSLFSMKSTCSLIRHNTTIHSPVEVFEHEGAVLGDVEGQLLDLCIAARRIKHGKQRVGSPGRHYEASGIAGGYS